MGQHFIDRNLAGLIHGHAIRSHAVLPIDSLFSRLGITPNETKCLPVSLHFLHVFPFSLLLYVEKVESVRCSENHDKRSLIIDIRLVKRTTKYEPSEAPAAHFAAFPGSPASTLEEIVSGEPGCKLDDQPLAQPDAFSV